MKNIKDSIKLFRFNMFYSLLYELILMTISFVILIPVYYSFISLTVKLSGVSYLTKETVKKFFRAPSTYAFILILFFLAAMFIMINVAGINYAYNRANYMMKTDPFRMLIAGITSSIRLLRPRNMPMAFILLFYLPVMGNIFADLRFMNIHAPFIEDIFTLNIYVTISILAIYSLLMLFFMKYAFIIHIYIVEKVSFRRAIDRTGEIMDKDRSKTVLPIFLWALIFTVIPLLINYYYTGPVLRYVLSLKKGFSIAMLIYEAIKASFSLVYLLSGLPLIYSFICNSYYNLVPNDEDKCNIDDFEEYNAKRSRKKELRSVIVLVCATLAMNIGFYALRRFNIIKLNSTVIEKVTITAHRGDSACAPENTLEAFEMAIENGADVIELDVRETKDGEIVVCHDESLKRICGVNKKIGKTKYKDLLKYDVSAKYKGKNKELYKNIKVRIPTLREAIETVGDRAKLNIEIKTANTDKDLEKKVAEIVNEYDCRDKCVVTSQTYGAIKRIKKYDPQIKTIYVMSIAMGDFYDLEYADGFSIKYRFINKEVIRQSHKRGKEVYAWVVDDEKTLEKMMLLNVDSVITNDSEATRKNMYENYYGDSLLERIENYLDNQL